ncbi:MAG: PfkB family carbohydrate kinase [Pseudomonadota bacterium]
MIATIGEALVDMIELADGRFLPCLGGSVCNFSLGAARQGMATSYLNPLSGDRFGDRFRALLTGNGVVLAAPTASICPTSLAMVSLDQQGVPTYAFHREGVADRDVTAASLIATLPAPLQLLHTGGLALVPQDAPLALEVMQAARTRGALVSVDANLRPMVVQDREQYVAGVKQVMRQADIVKLSDEDLDVLGWGDLDDVALTAVLFDNAKLGLVAITRGKQGAALWTRHQQVRLAAPADLAVVDTVGAGDSFHAGLLAYLLRSGQMNSAADLAHLPADLLSAALRHAIAAASINIMRSGCNPPTWEETAQFVW